MTPGAYPPRVDELQRGALVAGALGVAACGLGLFLNPHQFFRSYLFAFLFWTGIAVGALGVSMIHHLAGGRWGLVILRILEAATRTLPVLGLLFLPLVFGLPQLYLWARPEQVAADPLLQHKSAYLNVPFFLGRAAVYFAVWSLFAHLLSKWTQAIDQGGDREAISKKLRGLSGGGLVVMALTVTLAAVDWAMSLSPHWFSTVYGILFMVGQCLSALAFVVVLMAGFADQKPFAGLVRREQIHDLGKLLLAFVMLWAYINLSQFLITWSGNLPEEIPWYLKRLQGGWQWLGLALVLFHFVLPFLLLLSRDLKRNAGLLGTVAGVILVFRMVDLFWLVAPETAGGHGGHAPGFSVHWLDLGALLAVGGLWLLAFVRELKGRSLLPTGEPEIQELIEGAVE
ncbi:MAG TPA: hypothetical protein VJU18_12815 [Vicinamibacteria bacterium]|nr:hypothetical protein [Vicinamibacteria bacterium]